MSSKKYFGTDGIRGRVGVNPMTPEFVLKLGYAIGRVMAKHQQKRVVIGKDTRLSGYLFESSLEAGFSAAGIDIVLLGPMPTPAVAYLTEQMKADMGLVISASHNPYYDNGIKLFDANGYKVSEAMEQEIEAALALPLEIHAPDQLGKAQRYPAAVELYKNFCRNALSSRFQRNMKCVVDCANGATYHIAPDLMKDLGLEVIPIHTAPNGQNINDKCGSTALASLQEAVLKYKADFGVAFDGDGDRVSFVDEQANTLDGDDLLYILVKQAIATDALKETGVVGTLMTNLGLEQYLASQKIPFKRALVGDKYVLAELRDQAWHLGGESSGHLLNLDYGTTGDGIMSALQVIQAFDQTEGPFSALMAGFKRTPQTLLNFPVDIRAPLLEKPAVLEAIDQVKSQLADSGRILVRMSGTEPLLRVMLEAQDDQQVQSLSEFLKTTIQQLEEKTHSEPVTN